MAITKTMEGRRRAGRMAVARTSSYRGLDQTSKKVIPAGKSALTLHASVLAFGSPSTRSGEPMRSGPPTIAAPRWSAGRRSVRAAGLANLAIAGRARLGMGLANPSARRVHAPIARGVQGRRSAAPWRLPALHFLLRRDEENGTGQPAPSPKRGAERWLAAGSRALINLKNLSGRAAYILSTFE